MPLFVEELTRMVLGSEIAQEKPGAAPAREELPATLHDSLMARLDRLAAGKRVAQIAAVIGREFRYEILQAVASLPDGALRESLAQLIDAGLLFAHKSAPTAWFIFKHAMVRDAAYEGLLKRDRRELHAKVAAALEQQGLRTDQLEPELLAYHYSEAHMTALALKYWEMAAARATDKFASIEVLAHTERALELLQTLPDTMERRAQEMRIQFLAGRAYWAVRGVASPEAEKTFLRVLELAEELKNDEHKVLALRNLQGCYFARGELMRARAQAEQVIALAERMNSPFDLAAGRIELGTTLFWQGEFKAARKQLEEVLSYYYQIEHGTSLLYLGVYAECHLGWTQWALGFPDQGLKASNQAVTAALESAHPFTIAMALLLNGFVKLCRGDLEAVAVAAAELRKITNEYHIAFFGVSASVLEGALLVAKGEPARGVERIEQAFAAFRMQAAGLGLPLSMAISAAGCLGAGMIEKGLAVVTFALAAAERSSENHWNAELYRLKGLLMAARPGTDRAEAVACLEQAIETARRQGSRSLELRAVTSLSRLLAEDANAQRMLEELYTSFTEGSDTVDLIEARECLTAMGALPSAAQ
jgi:tetratricopeptide (TPR) repeat protein